MTDQLPAIILPGALVTSSDTYIVPALIAEAGDAAGWRFVEFFTANINNDHTRRAYARACHRFFGWSEGHGLTLGSIRPVHVAAWVKELQEKHGSPGVKQQLAAVRMLFDWLVTGQIVPMNPAAAVRGPKHVVKTGKTPVLDGKEWHRLIDAIPTDTVRDLRDRALIATLTYSFARIFGRTVPAGSCGCTRKAARSTPCRAITRSPRRCAPISTPPALRRTRKAGCFAPAHGTVPRC
jgi:hypothetical protein